MRVFAGMPVLVMMVVLGLGLSACGQRGPLILPNDASVRESKAIYIIPQKTQDTKSAVENKPNDNERVVTQ